MYRMYEWCSEKKNNKNDLLMTSASKCNKIPLKYVKNYLRHLMSQEHLENVMLMIIEKEMLTKINSNDILILLIRWLHKVMY
jgi:hypothetical protein